MFEPTYMLHFRKTMLLVSGSPEFCLLIFPEHKLIPHPAVWEKLISFLSLCCFWSRHWAGGFTNRELVRDCIYLWLHSKMKQKLHLHNHFLCFFPLACITDSVLATGVTTSCQLVVTYRVNFFFKSVTLGTQIQRLDSHVQSE